MKITKENQGVTLVVVIFTVIFLFIIAGTAIYIGTENISKTRNQLLLTEQ